jgi:hypothetical protein
VHFSHGFSNSSKTQVCALVIQLLGREFTAVDAHRKRFHSRGASQWSASDFTASSSKVAARRAHPSFIAD